MPQEQGRKDFADDEEWEVESMNIFYDRFDTEDDENVPHNNQEGWMNSHHQSEVQEERNFGMNERDRQKQQAKKTIESENEEDDRMWKWPYLMKGCLAKPMTCL